MLESWKGALSTHAHRSAWRRSRCHEATSSTAVPALFCKPRPSIGKIQCMVFLLLAMMMSGLHAGETIIKGKLQVLAIGHSDEERIALFVESPAGRLTELRAAPAQEKRLRRLAGGTQIELHGKHSSGGFTLSDFAILGAEGGTLDPGDPGTAHYAPTFGERKVAVLLVNFQDDQSEPGTVQQAQAAFDGEINDYFAEASYNKVSLTTDVYGWWTLPYNTSHCSDSGHLISSEILEEAASRGVDLSPYDHLVYVFNEPFGRWCSNGVGTVSPGSRGTIWRSWTGSGSTAEVAFDGVKGIETTIHELGHNLGLWHANRWDCGAEIVGESCSTVFYADFYDSMGSGSSAPHFNAFHKERLGWIDSDSSSLNQIETVVESGNYQISPYAADGGVKALRIRRGPNAEGGIDFFYLEFRQPIGWDDRLAQHAYEGLLVHLGNDTVADSSRLLNMTPDDMWEHVLRPGLPFYDPVSEATIELISADSSGASVDIIIGKDVTPPSADISTPFDGETLEKGSTLSFRAQAIDETAMGQVEFYVNGMLECTDAAAAPDDSDYACSYSVPKGKSRSLTIEARAIDAKGNVATAFVRVSTVDAARNNGKKK